MHNLCCLGELVWIVFPREFFVPSTRQKPDTEQTRTLARFFGSGELPENAAVAHWVTRRAPERT